MKVLFLFVSMIVAINVGYREEAGIPLAAIRASEDNIYEVPEMRSRIGGGEVAPVGAHPYAYLFRGGTRIKTRKFVTHPLHKTEPNIGDYDIAVVKLRKPVEFTDLIQPINIPSSSTDAEIIGEMAITAGWGLRKDNEEYVRRKTPLIQVRVQIIPELVCKKRLLGRSEIFGNNVCTDGAGRVGVCKGDSGAPLVVERDGQKMQVGVASFANLICELGYPAGYTRVATYLDFIREHL